MPLQVIGVILQALVLGVAVLLEVMESLSVLSPAENNVCLKHGGNYLAFLVQEQSFQRLFFLALKT